MRSKASRFEMRLMPLISAIMLCMALVTASANHPRLLASQDQKRAPAIKVFLPRNLKNADHDPAILKESAVVVSIPVDDELYIGSEQIKRGDFGFKLEQALKRQAEPNKIVYIAGGYSLNYDTVVEIISIIRKGGVDRIGLIVDNQIGNDVAPSQFLVQIPREWDSNAEANVNWPPLTLSVFVSSDLKLEINREVPDINLETKRQAAGTVSDSSSLSQKLTQIFQQRKERQAAKPGMETRTKLDGDERVEKTVEIKASRDCMYGEVVKVIDVVKGAGAQPINLRIDDLPGLHRNRK